MPVAFTQFGDRLLAQPCRWSIHVVILQMLADMEFGAALDDAVAADAAIADRDEFRALRDKLWKR